MPVDPSALIDAVMDGLSKIPSGIFAALLLAGPTAVWLILRFANPRDATSRFGSAAEELHWVCPECRSLNEDRSARCYRCFLPREDAILPVLAGVASAETNGVGIAVGPGLSVESESAGWLDEDLDDELDEVHETVAPEQPDRRIDPAAEELVPALATTAPEATPIFEPLALEPRAKPVRKPRASRSSRRA